MAEITFAGKLSAAGIKLVLSVKLVVIVTAAVELVVAKVTGGAVLKLSAVDLSCIVPIKKVVMVVVDACEYL